MPTFPPSIGSATAALARSPARWTPTYNRVLDESVIEHDGKLYAWTIPLALPVTAELAAQLKPGQEVALVNIAPARSSPRWN